MDPSFPRDSPRGRAKDGRERERYTGLDGESRDIVVERWRGNFKHPIGDNPAGGVVAQVLRLQHRAVGLEDRAEADAVAVLHLVPLVSVAAEGVGVLVLADSQEVLISDAGPSQMAAKRQRDLRDRKGRRGLGGLELELDQHIAVADDSLGDMDLDIIVFVQYKRILESVKRSKRAYIVQQGLVAEGLLLSPVDGDRHLAVGSREIEKNVIEIGGHSGGELDLNLNRLTSVKVGMGHKVRVEEGEGRRLGENGRGTDAVESRCNGCTRARQVEQLSVVVEFGGIRSRQLVELEREDIVPLCNKERLHWDCDGEHINVVVQTGEISSVLFTGNIVNDEESIDE